MRPTLLLTVTIALGSGCGQIPEDRAASTPSEVPALYATSIRTLSFDNGMRAVVAQTPSSPDDDRVFIGLYVGYGLGTQREPQLAHLTEHIAANNAPTVVDYEVPETITYFGSNAMTRSDYTSLWRAVSPDGLDAMVPHRANPVVGIADDPAIFAREVERVAGELDRTRQARVDHGRSADSALEEAFFGAGPSLDEQERALRGYDSQRVMAEIRAYYRPDNSVLVVAGDIDLEAASALVSRHLAPYPSRPGPRPAPGPSFGTYAGPLLIEDSTTSVTRVGIGFPAPDRSSPDFLAWLVLDQLLLGGRTASTADGELVRAPDSPLASRLGAAVRADSVTDGVAYRTDAPLLTSRSPQYFRVLFLVPGAAEPGEVAGVVRRVIEDVVSGELTDGAIESAKRDLLTFLATWMSSDDRLALGDHLAAFAMIDGDATRLHRLPAEILALSPERVRSVAERWLGPDGYRLAVVYPAPVGQAPR